MKTCKKGLHQYSDELKYCPECRKIWKDKPETKAKAKSRKQTTEYKAKAKLYKQTPKYKAKASEYSKSEKVKARTRARDQKPENKKKKKEWREKNKAKLKAKKKKWLQTPKGKLSHYEGNKRWNNSAGGKATKKTWAQSPKGKASHKKAIKKWKQSPAGKASAIATSAKRSIIAANGDLTGQQILERKEEFNGQCAYCHIELLTAKDNVNQTHPQYETIDHIIPLFDDDGNPKGEHTKANVIPACYKCNCTSKLNQDVWEWMKEKNITPSKKLIPILNKATGKRKRYRQ